MNEFADTLVSTGGKLPTKSLNNSQFLLSGNITIINGGERISWTGTKLALFCSGESENKPFCDGSHEFAGFNSSEKFYMLYDTAY